MGYDANGNIWVDTSATNNGDGSSPEQASSEGGTGAYNDLQDALDEAATSGGTRIITRNLNIGTSISITAQLSPANDGTVDNPLILMGWPFKRELTGKTVDSVPSGTDNLGYNNAQWQFVDYDLTEDDNYWLGATVTFTSGNNAGLTRRVIWFDGANHKPSLDFPLPYNIASGDQYTITLETEDYDDRPQSGIDEGWDNDTNPRPVLDGGGGSFHLFSFSYDAYWYVKNLEVKNVSSSYYLFYYLPSRLINCVLHDAKAMTYYGVYGRDLRVIRCHLYNSLSTYGLLAGYPLVLIEDTHFNKGPNGYSTSRAIYYYTPGRLQNCTIGRVSSMTDWLYIRTSANAKIECVNCMIDATNPVNLNRGNAGTGHGEKVFISDWQAEKGKFKQFHWSGEIYNLDENATIDPPSGATTFIKMVPQSVCCENEPLIHEERRYQSSGSKTYTWKFYPSNMSLGATDLEVEAWYLDESSGTQRAYATANPSAYGDGSWHDLSITVNPSQAGVVYFKIKLKKYNTSGCYVALDPKVSIS